MKKANFGKEPEEERAGSSLKNQRAIGPAPSSQPQPAAQPESAPAQEFMAEHTVKPDETLSHLSLKYYGSAIREKWLVIYEANKAVIGDNPAILRPGTVLKIPKLPA